MLALSQFQHAKQNSSKKKGPSFGEKPNSVKMLTALPKDPQHRLIDIPIEQLEEDQDFKYFNGLLAPLKFHEEHMQNDDVKVQDMVDCLLNLPFVNFGDDFALYDRDDAGGLSLFYVGKEPIKEQSFLFFYAGEVGDYQQSDNAAYVMKSSVDDSRFSEFISDGSHPMGIDAAKYGNLSRFIASAPFAEDLNHIYEFSIDIEAKNVATANLIACSFRYGLWDFLVFKSLCDITYGCELFQNYSDEYWSYYATHAKSDQLLFYNDGEMIPLALYKRILIPIKVEHPVVSRVIVTRKQALVSIVNQKPQPINNGKNETVTTVPYETFQTTILNQPLCDFVHEPMDELYNDHFKIQCREVTTLNQLSGLNFTAVQRIYYVTSLPVIDAVIKSSDESTRQQVLDRLHGYGFFCSQVQKKSGEELIVIGAIDHAPNSNALARMQADKTPALTPKINWCKIGIFAASAATVVTAIANQIIESSVETYTS